MILLLQQMGIQSVGEKVGAGVGSSVGFVGLSVGAGVGWSLV